MEVAEFHQVCDLKWQTWFRVAIDSFSNNKFCLKIYAAYSMFWHVLISFFLISACWPVVNPCASCQCLSGLRQEEQSRERAEPVLRRWSQCCQCLHEFYPLDGWHNFIGEGWVEVTFNYAWGMYKPPFFWSLPCVLPTDHPVWIFEFLNLQRASQAVQS